MATASCNGVATANGIHWWAMKMALAMGAGAMAHPIFQPVTEKVLPALPSVTVRSHMPGSVAMRTCSTGRVAVG